MNNTSLASWARPVAIATMVLAVMLAVLIISAEEVPALKDWLKATFSHHWLGKGALALILFAAMSFALRFVKSDTPKLSTVVLVETIVVVASTLSIVGFFLLHLLHLV